MPGILITSSLFTGAWGYLVYTGNISTIWPLFGMSNQLLASSALIIGTTMIIRLGKARYALLTAVPGILMAIVTFVAGYQSVTRNYLPKGQYLLAAMAVVVMGLMVVVFAGAFRKWSELLRIKSVVSDAHGDPVLEVVAE